VSRGAGELRFTFTQAPGATWPAGLYPGVRGLQLVVPQAMGTPPVAHGAVESNLQPLLLAPRITATKGTVRAADVIERVARPGEPVLAG